MSRAVPMAWVDPNAAGSLDTGCSGRAGAAGASDAGAAAVPPRIGAGGNGPLGPVLQVIAG